MSSTAPYLEVRSVSKRFTGVRAQVPAFSGAEDLSWHLVNRLVAEEFDLTTCQEMNVDHAFTLPMALCWPDQKWPVKVVPICINTVQFPIQIGRAHV